MSACEADRWSDRLSTTLCICVHAVVAVYFLIHTFKFCESACCCPVLLSPDRHKGNQHLRHLCEHDRGRRSEREKKVEREEWFIVFICFFPPSLRSLCPWQQRACKTKSDRKDGGRKMAWGGEKMEKLSKGKLSKRHLWKAKHRMDFKRAAWLDDILLWSTRRTQDRDGKKGRRR